MYGQFFLLSLLSDPCGQMMLLHQLLLHSVCYTCWPQWHQGYHRFLVRAFLGESGFRMWGFRFFHSTSRWGCHGRLGSLRLCLELRRPHLCPHFVLFLWSYGLRHCDFHCFQFFFWRRVEVGILRSLTFTSALSLGGNYFPFILKFFAGLFIISCCKFSKLQLFKISKLKQIKISTNPIFIFQISAFKLPTSIVRILNSQICKSQVSKFQV